MTTTERLVGRRAVADMWGVSPATVDRLEADGIIPRRRHARGRVFWLLSELVEAMHALPVGAITERTVAARGARHIQVLPTIDPDDLPKYEQDEVRRFQRVARDGEGDRG